MSLPRALVVRSGMNPFAALAESPRIEIVEKSSHVIEPVAARADAIEGAFQLAVFTSQIAVERLASDPDLLAAFRRALTGGRVAAVGAVTAEALEHHGIHATMTAAGSADGVLELLPKALDGWRVLLPCGQDASEELPEGLRYRGAHVVPVVVYRKVPRPHDAILAKEILEHPFAAFCTTSPSAARWLFESLPEAAADRLRATPAVVLGRFTRRFLESHGVSHIEMTEEQRFAAAVQLLERLALAGAEA
jgi:uroporphyrinogen III methyltransferase / synthase